MIGLFAYPVGKTAMTSLFSRVMYRIISNCLSFKKLDFQRISYRRYFQMFESFFVKDAHLQPKLRYFRTSDRIFPELFVFRPLVKGTTNSGMRLSLGQKTLIDYKLMRMRMLLALCVAIESQSLERNVIFVSGFASFYLVSGFGSFLMGLGRFGSFHILASTHSQDKRSS